MIWFKKLFSNKIQEIASLAEDPKLICWQFNDDRQIDPKAFLKVEEDQLVLILEQHKIKAILEKGKYPLNYIWDEPIDEALLKSIKLYYFTVKIFTDQRWGTAAPIALYDSTQGHRQLRAHGTFSYRLGNPKKLWRHLDSHWKLYKTEDIIGNLRSIILSNFSSMVNNAPELSQILQNQEALSKQVFDKLKPEFAEQGLQLEKFLIQSLSISPNS